jgi:hypothetical protein
VRAPFEHSARCTYLLPSYEMDTAAFRRFGAMGTRDILFSKPTPQLARLHVYASTNRLPETLQGMPLELMNPLPKTVVVFSRVLTLRSETTGGFEECWS